MNGSDIVPDKWLKLCFSASARQSQDFPVNEPASSNTSTVKSDGAPIKPCSLVVPGILYHIRRAPIEEANTSSSSSRGRSSQLVADAKKITAVESKITSKRVTEKDISTSMRHNVIKGLNPKSRFRKIILSKSLLSDHSLGAYKDGIKDALHWSCHPW